MDEPSSIPAPFEFEVLAEDRDARIECSTTASIPLLRKIYKSQPLLIWRSFWRPSRAQREASNLEQLAECGLPVVSVVEWSESRKLGFVTRSAVTTEFVPSAESLEKLIREERDPEWRRHLAREMGRCLRRLHEHWLCSTTMSPRNILVTGAGGQRQLLLCDQPHLTPLPRLRLSFRSYEVDLFDAFFSARRVRDWDRTERWRGVLEYCQGDRDRARKIWRRLSGRPRWVHSVARETTRLYAELRRWIP